MGGLIRTLLSNLLVEINGYDEILNGCEGKKYFQFQVEAHKCHQYAGLARVFVLMAINAQFRMKLFSERYLEYIVFDEFLRFI